MSLDHKLISKPEKSVRQSELRAMDPRLLYAARDNNAARIQQLVEGDPDILLGQTPEGNTALHLSARFRWDSSLETICQLCTPSTCCNNKGQTALHSAALGRNLKAVTVITSKVTASDVEQGGQESLKEMVRMVDSSGDTALHLAIIRGYDEDVASKLIDLDVGGLAEVVNNKGESPLYLASLSRMSRVVKSLLVFGSANSDVSVQPPDDQTDRHAAGTGSSCYHSNSRRAPGMHRTALHAAVIAKDTDIARELLRKWPEMNKEVDGSGWIPLHYAAKSGDSQMIKLLLSHDFSTGYCKDNNGNMAIHIAAQHGWGNTFWLIKSLCPDSVDAINEKGENVLHYIVRCLIHTASGDVIDTPELRLLINHQDNNGNTPLHLAILEDNFYVDLNVFLNTKELNPMIVNNDGYTAYDLFSSRETQLKNKDFFRKFFDDLLPKERNLSLLRLGGDLSPDTMERLQKYTSNSSIVATLMATITFAAAFTMPGGYSSETGKPALFRNAALKAFLISDTISMCCSLLAAYLFSSWQIFERPLFFYSSQTCWSPFLLKIAFWGMLVAFATGMYSVLAPNCMWLAILICILCSVVPFLNYLIENSAVFIVWMYRVTIDMVLWRQSSQRNHM